MVYAIVGEESERRAIGRRWSCWGDSVDGLPRCCWRSLSTIT